MIDLARISADTPGTLHRNHMNNAGAALMPQPVIETTMGHLRREAEIGGYEASAEAADRVLAVYDSLARLIGAHRDEIAITKNATVAWQRAFYAMAFKPGDRILTTSAEFTANYIAFLQVARRTGASVEVIPDDETGALDPDALQCSLMALRCPGNLRRLYGRKRNRHSSFTGWSTNLASSMEVDDVDAYVSRQQARQSPRSGPCQRKAPQTCLRRASGGTRGPRIFHAPDGGLHRAAHLACSWLKRVRP